MKNKTSKKVGMTVISFLLACQLSDAQTWTPNKKYIKEVKTEKKESTQCYGTTQKGERCKRKVKGNGVQYCTQHLKQK